MSQYCKYASVLTIAGSDSGGGAGIQADLKTISALGCYGMSAITALTAQNTCGVWALHHVPDEFIRSQIEAVTQDILPDAIKIGMIYTIKNAKTIADVITQYPGIPVVFDPVMKSTSGNWLMNESEARGIIDTLLPVTTLLTPNLQEASFLEGMQIENVEQMSLMGMHVMSRYCTSLLIKGGHMNSETLVSVLIKKDGEIKSYETERIRTKNTHGSGCTLSSAIACFLAKAVPLPEAIARAIQFVHNAIYNGKDIVTGFGRGPLNHFFDPERLIAQR
jgi:hydroxymethylpyrimidine/phosphomethylpyrimidine kinase